MYSTLTVVPILTKICLLTEILVKFPSLKFNKIPTILSLLGCEAVLLYEWFRRFEGYGAVVFKVNLEESQNRSYIGRAVAFDRT